jgi:hypothetical protein
MRIYILLSLATVVHCGAPSPHAPQSPHSVVFVSEDEDVEFVTQTPEVHLAPVSLVNQWQAHTSSLPDWEPEFQSSSYAFSSYANWLIKGVLMIGRYPGVEPSLCTNLECAEDHLYKLVEELPFGAGVVTWVSFQQEVPPQRLAMPTNLETPVAPALLPIFPAASTEVDVELGSSSFLDSLMRIDTEKNDDMSRTKNNQPKSTNHQKDKASDGATVSAGDAGVTVDPKGDAKSSEESPPEPAPWTPSVQEISGFPNSFHEGWRWGRTIQEGIFMIFMATVVLCYYFFLCC